MSDDYSIEQAIVEFGFIDGFVRETCSADDTSDDTFEYCLDALDQIRIYITSDNFSDRACGGTEYRYFLLRIGFIRGLIWLKPLPIAVCEALDRVTQFCIANPDRPNLAQRMIDRPEPEADHLSLGDHDQIRCDAIDGVDTTSPEYAAAMGRSPEGIECFWKSNGIDYANLDPSTPAAAPAAADDPPAVSSKEMAELAALADRPVVSFKKSKREWTDEQRAAQAERARGQKKPPFDEHFKVVKADFDAGVSLSVIGQKYHCSGGHVRNYLMKHGIDPRRAKGKANASTILAPATAEIPLGEAVAPPQ